MRIGDSDAISQGARKLGRGYSEASHPTHHELQAAKGGIVMVRVEGTMIEILRTQLR